MIDSHKIFADYFSNTSKEFRNLVYHTSKSLAEGNICLNINELKKLDENPYRLENTSISKNEILKEIRKLDEFYDKKVFEVEYERFYMQKMHYYESQIVENLFQRSKLVSENFQYVGELPDNHQELAEIVASSSVFSIITGGPGTGKTTTVAKILKEKFKLAPETKVVLLAPTGKAVVRLSESLSGAKSRLNLDSKLSEKFESIQIQTIHKFLGKRKQNEVFKYKEPPIPEADLIIIDESSMIDIQLMHEFLSKVPIETSLIFLGDKNQLSSVGAGSIFGDLCSTISDLNSFSDDFHLWRKRSLKSSLYIDKIGKDFIQDKIVELTKSHRFNDRDQIGQFSKAVLAGDYSVIDGAVDNNSQVLIHDISIANKILSSFAKQLSEYCLIKDTKLALKHLNNFKILSAVRGGDLGISSINKFIEHYIKAQGRVKPKLDKPFYHNQPIMITQNMSDYDIYNGDIGLIRENIKGELIVYFDDGQDTLKEVGTMALTNYELAYCMTVHKSQGSEFDNVLALFPDQDIKFYTRELLYTAVTRAKKSVNIISTKECLTEMTKKQVNRVSGIVDRIRNYGA